jgi:hypothetical protein
MLWDAEHVVACCCLSGKPVPTLVAVVLAIPLTELLAPVACLCL